VTDKYPHESLSEEEARLRHQDCEYIVDQDGEHRPAIFVWQGEDDADKKGPRALYWLSPTKIH
jgi:hypothetical protein